MRTSCNLPRFPLGREVCDDDARPSASGGALSVYFTLLLCFCFAWWWVVVQMSCTSSYALALLVALLALADHAQATQVEMKFFENTDCSGTPKKVETKTVTSGKCEPGAYQYAMAGGEDIRDARKITCSAGSDDIELKIWKKVRDPMRNLRLVF